MSPADYAVLGATMFVASGLQGSIGFGAGLVAAPVIALVEPSLLPALVVMLACVLTLLVAIRDRAALDVRGASWALAGRAPGSMLGAWLVVAVSATTLSWIVAIAVLTGIGSAFLGWRPARTPATLAIAGVLSGIMGTATSVGGAPMAIIWQGLPPARIRATMSAFFLVGSLMSVGLLAFAGLVTPAVVQAFLLLVPVVLAGFFASRWLNRFLDADRLRLAGLFAAAAGAVVLAVRLILGG
ncbi:permease [Zafaria cholistanensis]|uniref:Probable membrane transporter protein n=1 Tax=Zafaria cholistanensis TaxID=1682741 RepID=A0A5A7NRC9_9MICC|nr:sulfite exporter TauE/SafE family protein [Zafaria cholistanensis]GER23305.1 permease [Zafaria cholistanensis]